MQDAVQIVVGGENQANADVKQEVVVLASDVEKMDWLVSNIEQLVEQGKVLVFVSNSQEAREIKGFIADFCDRGLECLVIHGDLMQ